MKIQDTNKNDSSNNEWRALNDVVRHLTSDAPILTQQVFQTQQLESLAQKYEVPIEGSPLVERVICHIFDKIEEKIANSTDGGVLEDDKEYLPPFVSELVSQKTEMLQTIVEGTALPLKVLEAMNVLVDWSRMRDLYAVGKVLSSITGIDISHIKISNFRTSQDMERALFECFESYKPLLQQEIKSLNLTNYDLEILTEKVGELHQLAVLRLKNNELVSMPKNLMGLSHLVTLDLPNNSLRTLPDEFSHLIALQYLNISGNRMSVLPPCVFHMHALEKLYASRNSIQEISADIGNMTNLEKLKLRKNQIRTIPPEIGNLTNLKVLRLDNNQIAHFPLELCNLPLLEKLSLQDNYLEFLPAEIGNLHALTLLTLGDNRLTKLPSEIGLLINLQTLQLENTKRFPAAFVTNVTKALVTRERGNVRVFKKLETGHHNFLTEFPTQVCRLQSLEKVHLGNNYITRLPIGPLITLIENDGLNSTQIHLGGNPVTATESYKLGKQLFEAARNHALNAPTFVEEEDAPPATRARTE